MANVDLSLHAELASDYFQLRGLDAQTKLLTATVADLENQLDLTQRRLAGGVATEADVAQARTQLETVRAQLVDIGVARAQFEHAIGTIANLNLSELQHSGFAARSCACPRFRSACLRNCSSDAPILPRPSAAPPRPTSRSALLSARSIPPSAWAEAAVLRARMLATWIQGPSSLWSLGAQAAELLFDAGQRHALTDQARHNYEAQAAGYRNTVLQAFNDVEDQLSGLRILEQESGAEERAVASAQHSYDLSNQRYKGGVTSYLEVLTAEATLIANQRTAIDLQTRQFVASVGLVRALGGGWDVTQLPK